LKDSLNAQLDSAYTYFERATRNFEEADARFAAFDGGFTVAQQIAHTAQTLDWFFAGAFSPDGFDLDFEAHEREVRGVESLAAARTWFDKATEQGRQEIAAHSAEEWSAAIAPGPVMGGLPRASIFAGITDHTAHHRGELAVMARLLGKAPNNPYAEPEG